jgi:hypothetical protein
MRLMSTYLEGVLRYADWVPTTWLM